MEQKYYWILGAIVIIGIISIISICVWEKEQSDQIVLTNQEKCENTGGKWAEICPDCVGCPCDYYCDCAIERVIKSDITSIKSKIERNNECVSCQTDFDCRFINCIKIQKLDCTPKQCGMARDMCIEIEQKCIEGICAVSEKNYGAWDERTHNCIDEICVPI